MHRTLTPIDYRRSLKRGFEMVVLMAFGGLLIAASVVLIAYLVATARREDSYDDFATEDTVAVFEDDGRLFVFASPADGEWYVEFIGEATEAA